VKCLGRRVAVIAFLLCGCGRVGFDSLATGDGGPQAAIDVETFFDASSVCGAVPFNDGFDDGTPGPAWTVQADVGVTVTETSSRLEIALPTTATRYGQYMSTCTSDNRSRTLSARIANTVTSANGVQMYITIELDAQNSIGIQFQDGIIFSFHRVAGTYLDVNDLPYDPVAHRFWRLGGEAGNVVWDLSPDGVTWDRRFSEPAPFDLSITTYGIAAGIYVDTASPGIAAFDEVSVR
jgi:hypothetical protein